MSVDPLDRAALVCVDVVGDPYDFARLLADLSYPNLMCGALRIAGRADWLAVVDRLAPVERRQLLQTPALTRALLVATPEGRTRLRRWLDREVPLPALPREDLVEHIRYRVSLFGDLSFLELIIQALLRLPQPVQHFCVHNTVFVGVGRESRAWTSSADLTDCHGPKARLITLGPAADVQCIVHECTHVWHAPLPVDGVRAPAISAQGRVGLYALATRDGWADRIDDHQLQHERLAQAGAVAWGVQ